MSCWLHEVVVSNSGRILQIFFVGGDASFRQVTLTASRLFSVEEAGVDA